jgi:hypothetical protein
VTAASAGCSRKSSFLHRTSGQLCQCCQGLESLCLQIRPRLYRQVKIAFDLHWNISPLKRQSTDTATSGFQPIRGRSTDNIEQSEKQYLFSEKKNEKLCIVELE